MNLAKYRLQFLVNVAALFGVAHTFAQQLPVSQIQSLTPERILSQPNLNGELLRHLHWTTDGIHLAWIQSSPASTPSKLPISEIWSLDTATAHANLLVSAAQLTTALASASPAHKAKDDDHPQATPSLSDYAWSPDGHALLLITPVSLVWLDLQSGHTRVLVSSAEESSDVQLSPDGRYV